MPLRIATRRQLTVMPPLPRQGYQPTEEPRFNSQQAFTITGRVQPLASQMEAALYGERAQRMLLLLASLEEPLAEGMGVCVHTLPEEGCDYRIAAPPEAWRTHWRVALAQV